MDCVKEANSEKCPCTYTSCERHGACCQCIAYHRDKNEMVACYYLCWLRKVFMERS